MVPNLGQSIFLKVAKNLMLNLEEMPPILCLFLTSGLTQLKLNTSEERKFLCQKSLPNLEFYGTVQKQSSPGRVAKLVTASWSEP